MINFDANADVDKLPGYSARYHRLHPGFAGHSLRLQCDLWRSTNLRCCRHQYGLGSDTADRRDGAEDRPVQHRIGINGQWKGWLGLVLYTCERAQSTVSSSLKTIPSKLSFNREDRTDICPSFSPGIAE